MKFLWEIDNDIFIISTMLFINAPYLSTVVPGHQHADISLNIFRLIVANLGRMLMLIILEMLLVADYFNSERF